VVGPGGEGEAVEVCVGDAEVLGLTALVRSHGYVAVSTAGKTAGDECQWVYFL
jgi:hypothetical protein